YVLQQLECLIERHKKGDGRYICTRQEWIVEVDLKDRGVHIPALNVRFPKQEGQNADADEHDDHLKKYCGASFHGWFLLLVRCKDTKQTASFNEITWRLMEFPKHFAGRTRQPTRLSNELSGCLGPIVAVEIRARDESAA